MTRKMNGIDNSLQIGYKLTIGLFDKFTLHITLIRHLIFYIVQKKSGAFLIFCSAVIYVCT